MIGEDIFIIAGFMIDYDASIVFNFRLDDKTREIFMQNILCLLRLAWLFDVTVKYM